jgi:hypothetical protein
MRNEDVGYYEDEHELQFPDELGESESADDSAVWPTKAEMQHEIRMSRVLPGDEVDPFSAVREERAA